MKAAEIRNLPVKPSDVNTTWALVDVRLKVTELELLREIAAQLAEINFHFSDLCYKADVALNK